MGSLQHHNIDFKINPPPPVGTQVGMSISPLPLLLTGMNISVAISTASAYLRNPSFNKDLASKIIVMAHLDTGASRTSIDIGLAQHLKLLPTGISPSLTAGGLTTMPTFAADLSFPNTSLSAFVNLPIGSCRLNFNIKGNLNDPKNFAVLLGRDVLSRWNVVWNGPTSTVLIND